MLAPFLEKFGGLILVCVGVGLEGRQESTILRNVWHGNRKSEIYERKWERLVLRGAGLAPM